MSGSTLRVRNDSGEVSLILLLALVVRYWLWIAAGALVFATFAWVRVAGEPSVFTTTASFVPQGRRSSAGSGLAAQFGFSGLGGDLSQSPQFYVDLVTSGAILRPVVDSVFTFRTDTGVVRAKLIDRLSPEPGPYRRRRELAVGALRGWITAGASSKTGVISLTVRTAERELSQQVAARLLERINTFYLESRIEQAVIEREFTAARRREVEAELRAAENRLQVFMQANRDFSRSPQLSFAQNRLSREVDMRQQVYTALAQAYEQARIEELRDTPVITVLEHPQLPISADPRTSLGKTFFAAVLGGSLAFLLGLLRDVFFRGGPGGAPGGGDMAALRAALRGAGQDLRHPLRKLRRPVKSGR